MKKIISFPHMGNYYIPMKYLLSHITKYEVMEAPSITKRTLEIGSKYSPDFVCIPFKYNLGNFIEALEKGANVLIQAGGGCRYGYYAEVQEQILKDLGYKFEFINLLSIRKKGIIPFYKEIKKIDKGVFFLKKIYYFLLSIKMVDILDNIEKYIRENIGFEEEKGSFEKIHKEFLNDIQYTKSFKHLNKIKKEYEKKFKTIKINKPSNCLKVGIIGELYTIMEPFSNYYLEKELAKNNIEITRATTLTYLLFKKGKYEKKHIKQAGKYLKYHIGADGTESVSISKRLAELKYDGIIHTKPFGCMPEVDAMPILQNISNDYKIPILYFSFDSQTSETGIKTRLEAFYDMLLMRKEKNNE
jgi:predicted nucleotide-binding protein (sugar kinase/HSP70/actin superfamily)